MSVLLDTCVLSEIQRPGGNPHVRAYVAALDPDTTFLSVITIGELTKGVALLEPGKKRNQLQLWLAGLELRFRDQLLPIDEEVARHWGDLTAAAQRQGVSVPVSDGLIAATGLRHGLGIVTRNNRHFEATGVRIIDPWTENR